MQLFLARLDVSSDDDNDIATAFDNSRPILSLTAVILTRAKNPRTEVSYGILW